ncbi:hypothetical protein Tco_0728545 [Tanacetum coccineum]|uniref:Reverse transcriptase Ty1/copia-type domain-containing protein n=1 Tax=Tanacetum coccineum TaxID=301880 RepID=A0ABQ4YLF0_9ASTR
MSSMGELTFFLGLQVTQKDDRIFISQDKYVDEILKKFGFSTVKIASTPMETSKPLLKDAEAEDVDTCLQKHLMLADFNIYLPVLECLTPEALIEGRTVNNGEQEITAIVDGKEFTINEASVRRHLQLADVDGQEKRFLNPYNRKYIAPALTLKLFSNMKRGFSGEHTPLFPSMLAIQAEEGEGLGYPSKPQPLPSTAQPTHEEPIPNVTSEPIPNVPDEAVYEEWDDRVERAITIAASLDAKQANGNINRTQSTAIPNMPLPQGIGASGSPRCQEAMGGSIAQTRSERVPTQPYDLPLPRVNPLGSDEGSMTLIELTVLCTTLSKKVESLDADLKRRAKIVVSDDEEDLEDSSKQGRMIEEIDQDAGVTLVTPTHSQEDQPEDQLGVFSAAKVLVNAAKENVHTYTRRRRAVSTGSGRISTAEESVNIAGASMPVIIKDKGKAKMDEYEPEQTKTKLQQRQERAGYEAAIRLQEQIDEEDRKRIARVQEEASSFNIEEWEDIKLRGSKFMLHIIHAKYKSFLPMGSMSTKIELTLEQSQQGVSNDVLVSIEGVEE